MSTPNFKTMEDFPLICGGAYNEYRQVYAADDEDDDVCIYDEITADARHYETKAELFNTSLQYYEVSIEDGYYDGWQFLVTPKDAWTNDAFHKDSIFCIDNEDAHYYWGKCRSKVLREAEAERRKINKWLEKQAKNAFMHKLVCLGVFSNGEAIYDEA